MEAVELLVAVVVVVVVVVAASLEDSFDPDAFELDRQEALADLVALDCTSLAAAVVAAASDYTSCWAVVVDCTSFVRVAFDLAACAALVGPDSSCHNVVEDSFVVAFA